MLSAHVKHTVTIEIAGTRYKMVSDAPPERLEELAAIVNGGGTANVGVMVNWRALLALLWPDVGSTTGVVIVTVLGVLTLVPLVVRMSKTATTNEEGTWLQCALVLIATILVSYHSHVHGILLLLAQLCGVLSYQRYRF